MTLESILNDDKGFEGPKRKQNPGRRNISNKGLEEKLQRNELTLSSLVYYGRLSRMCSKQFRLCIDFNLLKTLFTFSLHC